MFDDNLRSLLPTDFKEATSQSWNGPKEANTLAYSLYCTPSVRPMWLQNDRWDSVKIKPDVFILPQLAFHILQPGVVAGLIPFFILREKVKNTFVLAWKSYHYLAIMVFAVGFIIMLVCIISFAVYGRGILSPVDPTKKLVTVAFYQFSRNPMYLGVILILIGEAIFFRSILLCYYALFIFIAFNFFIILVEEPRLRQYFGEEYTGYCQKVRRWL